MQVNLQFDRKSQFQIDDLLFHSTSTEDIRKQNKHNEHNNTKW